MPMLTINININHHHKDEQMSYALEDIRREVEEARTVQGSAIALIKGLRDNIQVLVDRATDVDQLKADLNSLSTDLSSVTDSLAAAVVATDAPGAIPVGTVNTADRDADQAAIDRANAQGVEPPANALDNPALGANNPTSYPAVDPSDVAAAEAEDAARSNETTGYSDSR